MCPASFRTHKHINRHDELVKKINKPCHSECHHKRINRIVTTVTHIVGIKS